MFRDLHQEERVRGRSNEGTPRKDKRLVDTDEWQGEEAEFYHAARLPESTKNLSGHKGRIQEDMRDMEARITIREKGGAEQFVCKEMRQEISNIETGMEDVVQMFGQQTRSRTGRRQARRRKSGD